MILRFVLFLVIVYLISRFVTRFILPILKITRMTHSRMNEMQRKMEEMQHGPKPHQQRKVDGDYIDYEEVK